MFSGDTKLEQRQQRFVVATSLAIAILGVVVLLGWITGSDLLKSIIPGQHGMKPNAALCFLLLGGSLAATCCRSAWSQLASSLAAAAVAGISLVTLYEFGARVDLGIDRWLGLTDAF